MGKLAHQIFSQAPETSLGAPRDIALLQKVTNPKAPNFFKIKRTRLFATFHSSFSSLPLSAG